jgi:Ca2+-binding RTX toxin-like protein
MAYVATGTAGNDTLNQSTDTGPGTIVGLAGDDCIFQGTGLATITGDSGNDTVVLQTGNTGTVNGGAENDSIFAAGNAGSMQLFGSDGADTFDTGASSNPQTIVGGNDSSDAADSVFAGPGSDLIFGNGGNDIINPNGSGNPSLGNDTVIGGFGNDTIIRSFPGGNDLVFGNQGNDVVWMSSGNDTYFGGLGNDSLRANSATAGGNVMVFGNEGNDTVDTANAFTATIVGGQDSADGADSLFGTATGADIVFGNGGADTISVADGANTAIGGQGGDSILAGINADLIFANEANDTVVAGDGANTVFGGQGNDSILGGAGRETLQGNEGNDTIDGDGGATSIDTISGGAGNDVFFYVNAAGDGNNAAGGGPVEFLTDVDWSVDRIRSIALTFANNFGAGTGVDLATSATNALNAAAALNGGVQSVAAQFTFGGRTYVALNTDLVAGFLDTGDLLFDITGVTGTISATNFIA